MLSSRYALILSAIALTSTSADASDGTACDLSRPLLESHIGAAVDPQSFLNDGKQYPVKVISLAQPAPWGTNFMCLRYKIENSGAETIPLMYWHLIDEKKTHDLAPGVENAIQRKRVEPTIYKQPMKTTTKVKAFRSEVLTAEIWTVVEKVSSHAENKISDGPTIVFAKMSSFGGAISSAIVSDRLVDAQIAIVKDSRQKDGLLPPLSDELKTPLGTIVTSSVGVSDKTKGSLISRGQVGFISDKGYTAEIYAPAIPAMMESKSSEQFIELARKMKEFPRPIGLKVGVIKGGQGVEYYASNPADIYIVDHPITAVWRLPNGETQVQCMRAATYSPFPVSLGAEYCVDK